MGHQDPRRNNLDCMGMSSKKSILEVCGSEPKILKYCLTRHIHTHSEDHGFRGNCRGVLVRRLLGRFMASQRGCQGLIGRLYCPTVFARDGHVL